MPPALPTIAFAVLIAATMVQLSVAYVLWTELWFGRFLIVGRAWGDWLWPRLPLIALTSMLSHAIAAALFLLHDGGIASMIYGGAALVLAVTLPAALRRLGRLAAPRGRHERITNRARDRL